jgi:hypothetical protein
MRVVLCRLDRDPSRSTMHQARQSARADCRAREDHGFVIM